MYELPGSSCPLGTLILAASVSRVPLQASWWNPCLHQVIHPHISDIKHKWIALLWNKLFRVQVMTDFIMQKSVAIKHESLCINSQNPINRFSVPSTLKNKKNRTWLCWFKGLNIWAPILSFFICILYTMTLMLNTNHRYIIMPRAKTGISVSCLFNLSSSLSFSHIEKRWDLLVAHIHISS